MFKISNYTELIVTWLPTSLNKENLVIDTSAVAPG